MTKANTQAAKAFGATAFAQGVKCAPALCGQLKALFAGRQVGDKRTAPEMQAWIAGWTQANLAA